MKNRILLLTIIALVFVVNISPAAAEYKTMKTYSFNKKKAPKEWSSRKTFKIADDRCLGLFNNRNKRYSSKTILTLADLPKGQSIRITFDMFFIGSWDNEGKLADRFTVTIVDGPVVLDMNQFPCTLINNDDTRPVNNTGFVQVGERKRAYWIKPITIDIPHADIKAQKLELEFKGYLTGRKTEFWAINNVQIKTN